MIEHKNMNTEARMNKYDTSERGVAAGSWKRIAKAGIYRFANTFLRRPNTFGTFS